MITPYMAVKAPARKRSKVFVKHLRAQCTFTSRSIHRVDIRTRVGLLRATRGSHN